MKEECWDEQTRRAVDHMTLSDNERLHWNTDDGDGDESYPVSLHLLYLHSLYFYARDVLHPFPNPLQWRGKTAE